MHNARANRTVATIRARRELGLTTRRRQVLPRQIPPDMIATDYTRLLLTVVARVREAFEPLERELPVLLERVREARRLDVGEGARVRVLIAEAQGRLNSAFPQARIRELAQQFAARTSTWQRLQLAKQVRAAVGVDLFVVDPAALTEAFNAWVENQVDFFQDLATDTARQVQLEASRAITDGLSTREVTDNLAKRFGFAENRARLIARDQIGKLYGQINAQRQQALGVDTFIWRTVQDRRVRPEHTGREGREFKFSDPPSDGIPGEPVQCRCFAEPSFQEMLDAL